MMKNNKIKVGVIFASLMFFLTSFSKVSASEGTAELENVAGGKSRCFAASVLLQNFNYRIIVSCRDLIYPGAPDVFNYSIWAQETDSDKVHKLGSLGFGKAEFMINKSFSRLFVTLENADNARRPSDRLVMSGDMKSIPLLDEVSSDETEEETSETENSDEKVINQQEEVPFLQVDQNQITNSNSGGFSALKLVGGILIGVIVFVVIVALVSASRRRPIE